MKKIKVKAFEIATNATWFKAGDTLKTAEGIYLYIWCTNKNKCLVEILPKNKILRSIKETIWDIYRYMYEKQIFFWV